MIENRPVYRYLVRVVRECTVIQEAVIEINAWDKADARSITKDILDDVLHDESLQWKQKRIVPQKCKITGVSWD